jgi:hypothetical protein
MDRIVAKAQRFLKMPHRRHQSEIARLTGLASVVTPVPATRQFYLCRGFRNNRRLPQS